MLNETTFREILLPTCENISQNETGFLDFLSKKLIEDINVDKCLVVTFNDTYLTYQPVDLTDLVPCTIEEGDKRIFFSCKKCSSIKYQNTC